LNYAIYLAFKVVINFDIYLPAKRLYLQIETIPPKYSLDVEIFIEHRAW